MKTQKHKNQKHGNKEKLSKKQREAIKKTSLLFCKLVIRKKIGIN